MTAAALTALLASASAAGTFVDCDGGSHEWSITDTHVLLWDGEPYVPFGGMYAGRAFWDDSDAALDRDRQILTAIREHGIEDLYLNPVREVPPPRLQQVIDILEELGFRYGLQVCTPPTSRMGGYDIRPERPAEPLDPGGAVEREPNTEAAWIADEDAARTCDYLRQLRLGPGFRFLIDPIGNEYHPPRFFLPADEAWRSEFAAFLEGRYGRPQLLAQAWGLAKPMDSAQASRLVPIAVENETGHAADAADGSIFRVDLSVSRMWDDMCEARELSLRRRLNNLCDTLKAVCDVPVIAKRHHEATRVWINRDEEGGLDGLGMESYGGGDRLGTFNAAATYAEVAQARRPMWCLVTEFNGCTWTDRHIAYPTRGEMYDDLNLLFSLGARGIFMFGLSLAGSDGDKNWTIFELIHDPRQLEWLATFGRAARERREWLDVLPNTAFSYPPQPSDANAFTAGPEEFGLSGSWSGERSILKLGPGRWLAPVFYPDIAGPLLHSPPLRSHPRFLAEATLLRERGTPHHETSLAEPLALPPNLAQEFAEAPEPPVDVRVLTHEDAVEAVHWLDAAGESHLALRATGEAVEVTLDAPGPARARLPGEANIAPVELPLTVTLPGAPPAPRTFILGNPGFMAEPVAFECEVGDSPDALELVGVELPRLSMTVN